MNTLEDLLSEEELTQYNENLYPFNLKILDKALKAKVAEDPDYEVWVPLIYCKSADVAKLDRRSLVIKPYKVFISNKGRVVSLREEEPAWPTMWLQAGYWITRAPTGGEDHGVIRLHRALACSFVPVGDELGGAHPIDLQVNHLDGVKANFTLDNLEWSTPAGNTQHAHANGLAAGLAGEDHSTTKPAKGRILRGPHEGFEFILSGRKIQIELGFLQTSINKCCVGRQNEHKHCSWSYATPEELKVLPRGLPETIHRDLMAMPPAPKCPARKG